ncbi:MAG: hypothetical protein ABIJ41_00015 [Candidatus Omnitrophota bacterium]
MNCKNHSDIQAQYCCENCKNYFCEECLLVRRFTDEFTAFVCKECGGKCVSLMEARSSKDKRAIAKIMAPKRKNRIAEVKTQDNLRVKGLKIVLSGEQNIFFRYLGAFIFPLKGWGLPLMAAFGGSMFLLNNFLNRPAHISLISWVIVMTYFLVCLYKVTDDSSRGSTRIGRLPTFNYWVTMPKPLFLMTGAIILCFAPAHVYFFLFGQDVGLSYLGLLFLGSFFFPIFLIKIVLSRSLRVLTPIFALLSISRYLGEYIALCIFLSVSIFLSFFLINDVFSSYQEAGESAGYFVNVYVLFIEARLLGIFAHHLYEKQAQEAR